MESIRGAIENTVPISHFNRGLAGKIFNEVKHNGPKVVIKNNVAECVLLSPAEYLELMEEVNNARLLAIATERMAHFDKATLISQEDFDRKYGFTAEDLADADEVEIE